MKFYAILLLALMASGATASARALTFEQTWQKVLQQHPLVSAANNRLAAADFKRAKAGLRPNPRLIFEAENLYGSGEYERAGQAETAVMAEQTFERGGKRAARSRLSEQQLAGQQLESRRQLRLLRQEVRRQFNRVLLAQERLQLTQTQQQLASQNTQTVARLHEAGAATSDDLARARLQLQSTELELTRMRQQRLNASQQLAALWGDMYHTDVIEAEGPLLFINEPLTINQALAPLDSGIDQKIAEQHIRAQQAEVNLEKANAKVDVTVAAGVRRFSASDEYAFTVGASVPLQIFNNNQAGINGAYAQMRAAQQDADYVKRQVSAQVLAAFRRWQQADQALTTLEADILPAAENVLSATRKAYERGSYSYLQVLDAQDSLLRAQRQRLDLRADAADAMTLLERYIEPLDPIAALSATTIAQPEATP
ncbi:TolC family protein [uncultured Gilvimarinus sp.]|uniref:TolC family protein n=1 Tax=uncultured Gilvimarinus sp. TaxID=1689143 RepID=UPI0030EF9465|tara:strand:+ start:834 stop:2114 length:1281 start_codon:yes stop_codon:yes gene_type:complete